MTESPLDKDSLGQRPFPQTETTPDTDHLLDREPLDREPPPVDRMTDAFENITLLQTSFVGGNKFIVCRLNTSQRYQQQQQKQQVQITIVLPL